MLKVYAETVKGRQEPRRPNETMGDFIRRTGGTIVGATPRTAGTFAPVSNQNQRGPYAGAPNRRVRG